LDLLFNHFDKCINPSILSLSKLIPNKFGVLKNQFIFAPSKIDKMNSEFRNTSLKAKAICFCAEFMLSLEFMRMR
jgi:hypothetical protein